jgi:hypothetical protein
MPWSFLRVELLQFYQSPRGQGTSGEIWSDLQLNPTTIFGIFEKKRFDLIFYFLLQDVPKGLSTKYQWVYATSVIRVDLLQFHQSPRRQVTSGEIWRNLKLSPATIFDIFEKSVST